MIKQILKTVIVSFFDNLNKKNLTVPTFSPILSINIAIIGTDASYSACNLKKS